MHGEQHSLRVSLEDVDGVDGRVPEVPQPKGGVPGRGDHQALGGVGAAVRQLLVVTCVFGVRVSAITGTSSRTTSSGAERTRERVNQLGRLHLVQVGSPVPGGRDHLPASHQPIGGDHDALVTFQGGRGHANGGDLAGAFTVRLAFLSVRRVLVVIALRSLRGVGMEARSDDTRRSKVT